MAEELLRVRVACGEARSVQGGEKKIVMIPFTGTAEGPLFSGRVVGTGVDTQTIGRDGVCHLSARYLLEGRDASGLPCRVFIENNGTWEGGFRPLLVTDSPLLSSWETAGLFARVTPAPNGVTVTLYAE